MTKYKLPKKIQTLEDVKAAITGFSKGLDIEIKALMKSRELTYVEAYDELARKHAALFLLADAEQHPSILQTPAFAIRLKKLQADMN